MNNTRNRERKSKTILNSGINKIKSNEDRVICYRALKIPVGSKLYIIKSDEIILDNPLLHIETSKDTNKYTTDRNTCILTCNNDLYYDYLIQSNDRYYTIDYTMKRNENTLYHYGLTQIEYGSLLVIDSVDDIKEDKIFDITSIIHLINAFTKVNLDIYPKSLMVLNKDMLNIPGLFIQILDSKSIQQGFSASIGRIDRVRLFFNNYSRKEVMEALQKFNNMINDNILCICGSSNIYNIKEMSNDSLVNDITYYSDFEVYYELTDKFTMDVKHYIKNLIVKLNEVSNDKDISINVNK